MRALQSLIIPLLCVASVSAQQHRVGTTGPEPPPLQGQGRWHYRAPLPHARSEVAVAEVSGKVYVIGGYADGFVDQPLNEEYDPTTNAWRGRAPIGRLVDIGGRRLHLYCLGRGAPTVIMENGQSSFSIDWALVQPKVARVIDYGNGDLVRIVQLSDATFS